jgi:hypothetical protein
LEFPEIFQERGFNAFVGNPPFIGGKKITGTLGKDYRNYAVNELASGQRGHADLSAYFFLRAYFLIKTPGMFGLLATNTISQGDTREVGLDQIVKAGGVIFKAIKSAPWPGDAALEIAHVWVSSGGWKAPFLLAEETVSGITPFLEASSTIRGTPLRLKANADKSFIGSYVLGMGFLLSPEEATELLGRNPRNREVLYPFLIGEDLNSRIDQTPSRWVINFHDWPLDRSATGSWLGSTEKEQKVWLTEGLVPCDYPGEVAADYPDCLDIIKAKVKPERTRKDSDGEFVLRYPLYVKWWLYADKRPLLYWTIRNNEQVIVVTQTSKFHSFAAVPNGYTYGHKLVVFSSEDFGRFAVLQSSLHTEWVLAYGSSLETRPVYTPSDCFETFPFPLNESGLSEIGHRYHEFRRQLMLRDLEGLTDIYNRLHDPSEKSSEILEFRNLQIELDNAVAKAYGPLAPALEHGFYMTRYGLRFSINKAPKVIGWLLNLNHERYEEEVAEGLHNKKAGIGKRRSAKTKLEKTAAQGELL